MVVQILLSIFTEALAYSLAKRYFDTRVALWSMTLLMVSKSHIPFPRMILTEVVFGFAFLLVWWLLLSRDGSWRWVVGGLVMGYAALVRPIGLPLLVGALACTLLTPFRLYLKRFLIATLAFWVVVLPWSWRCSSIYGKLMILPSEGYGTGLFFGAKNLPFMASFFFQEWDSF